MQQRKNSRMNHSQRPTALNQVDKRSTDQGTSMLHANQPTKTTPLNCSCQLRSLVPLTLAINMSWLISSKYTSACPENRVFIILPTTHCGKRELKLYLEAGWVKCPKICLLGKQPGSQLRILHNILESLVSYQVEYRAVITDMPGLKDKIHKNQQMKGKKIISVNGHEFFPRIPN